MEPLNNLVLMSSKLVPSHTEPKCK